MKDEKARPERCFFYIVSRDYGFAPNPFYDYCTLACCKSPIRKAAKKGDWIIGLGSKALDCRECLIYAMKVTKTLTFNQYFDDEIFKLKKPIVKGSLKVMHGDNIYHKKRNAKKWTQLDSHHHHCDTKIRNKNIEMDTKTDRVLISNHFYYFGNSEKKAPDEILKKTEKLRSGYKYKNLEEEGKRLIEKFKSECKKNFIYGDPISWKSYKLG